MTVSIGNFLPFEIRFLLLLLFFISVSFLYGQNTDLPSVTPSYDTPDAQLIDILREEFSKNKSIPKSIEPQVLLALSHYPELKEVPIEFVIKKHNTAHTSAPKVFSLFKKRPKRKYKIVISNEIKPLLEPGLHHHLSFNAQVGVIGHELGHTAYYQERNSIQVMSFGIKYLFKKFQQEVENETDRIAIQHNLGYQLLAWSREVHHILEAAGRGDNYLTPEEIGREIQ